MTSDHASLPFDDTTDFDDARRGFLGRLEPAIVRAADGRVVWDNESYRFLDGPAPATANPSLWRQSQLNTIDGLFEVVPGIYQVRGFDLSNITFVEGDTGVLVIDPLISTEPAAAALALYREHRGNRPVVGVMYSHSHADHFGGVKGVTTQEDVDAGRCVVIAPDGFLEHAVSENVYAGTAMLRRAGYMFGAALERGPAGQIGTGLGQTNSTGTVSLIAPTDTIMATGETRVVDGIRMEFQVTPGTEAPAEMNTLFPDHGALWMAENATHVLHNVLTIRGAVVRDARVWARYLTEAIHLYGDRMDVVFASHHWPTWGRERALRFLGEQRDLYAYLHDQTLRMLNQGMNGAEIAEAIELPPALERAWHARGYYGSVSHNVKAIYQRYMGWYDGNPARLWQHTPAEQAKRYVAAMGGIERRRRPRAVRVRGPRPAMGRRAAGPSDLRRPGTRRRPGAAGADSRAARPRGRERAVAQRVPRRCHGAPARLVRDAGDHLGGPAPGPRAGADLRRHRDPRERPPGVGRDALDRHRAHRCR